MGMVASMELDMKTMHDKHIKLVDSMRQSYQTIEEENEKHVFEFFNALKTKTSEKLSMCKDAYVNLSKDKEDMQNKMMTYIGAIKDKYEASEKEYREKMKELSDEREKEKIRYEATVNEMKKSYDQEMNKGSMSKKEIISKCDSLIKENGELINKGKTYQRLILESRNKFINEACKFVIDGMISKIENGQKIENLRKELSLKEQKFSALESNKFNPSRIIDMGDIPQQNKVKLTVHFSDGDTAETHNYNALFKQKKALQVKINNWCQEFQNREGRKPAIEDKQPIRQLFDDYREIKAKIKELYESIQNKRDNDLNESGVSIETDLKPQSMIESRIVSAEVEELRLENNNLKTELADIKEKITNGMSENAVVRQLKLDVERAKKETDAWRIKSMEHNNAEAKQKQKEFDKIKKERDHYRQQLSKLEENMSENLMKIELGRLTNENEDFKKKLHELDNIANRAAELELGLNNRTEELEKSKEQLRQTNEQISFVKQKAEKYDTILIEFENMRDKAAKEGASTAILESNKKLQKENLDCSSVIESLKRQIELLDQQVASYSKGGVNLKSHIEKLEKENNELTDTKNNYHKMEAELDQLRIKLTTLSTKDVAIETLKSELGKMQDDNVILSDKLNKLKDTVSNAKELRTVIEAQKKEIFESKEKIGQLSNYRDELLQTKSLASSLQDQVNRLREQLAKPSDNDDAKVAEIKAELLNVSKEKENVELTLKTLQASYTECEGHKQKIDVQEEEMAQLRNDLTRSEHERERLKSKAESTSVSKSHINQLRLLLAKSSNQNPGTGPEENKDAQVSREMNRIIKENADLTLRLEKSERSNKDTKMFVEKAKDAEAKLKAALSKIRDLEKQVQSLQSTKPAISNEQSAKFREEKKEMEKLLKAEQAAAKLAKAEAEKWRLKAESTKDKELLSMNDQIKKSETAHKIELQNMEKRHMEDMVKKERETSSLNNSLKKLTDELDKIKKEKGEKESSINTLTKNYQKMEIDLDRYKKAAELMVGLEKQCQSAEKDAKENKEKAIVLEKKYKEEMLKRKKVHNMLEDMKGKIRVFCRVRPMNEKERELGCTSVVAISDEFTVNLETNAGVKQFSFDSCFGTDTTQEAVFEDTKRLIQSAVDGYNVCIFAYGQTGSGKTFTIQGVPNNEGVAPRSFMELFDLIKQNSNIVFTLQCYMVELYLNHLRDLMATSSTKEPLKLEIKEDIKGTISVQNATIKPFTKLEEVQNYFESGLVNRQTSKTLMNDTSSRSHLVFIILINSENKQTGQKIFSKLSFVDLAGSERVSKSGATADRLKEGAAINTSLSKLGDVIAALSDECMKFK